MAENSPKGLFSCHKYGIIIQNAIMIRYKGCIDMLPLDFFDYDNLSDTDKKVTEYVNDKVKEIIRVLIDFLDNGTGFNSEDFLPYNNIKISDSEWIEMVHTLYEIVSSPNIRDYLKPKYDYLLYAILLWWKDCNEGEYFYNPEPLDDELKKDIENEYMSEDGECYILNAITDVNEYFYILFPDHDFLPHILERFTMMYLNSPEKFSLFFGDTNLDDYKILMPKDLRERYEDINKQKVYNPNDFSEEDLLGDIRVSCERIQANKKYKYTDCLEDEFNDAMRNMLKMKYIVSDQTRRGESASGKSAGEVDLLIEKNNLSFSIIEALKLDCVNKQYISEHIDKIFGYDTIGNHRNYIISYVKSKNFQSFWKDYYEFVKNYSYPIEFVSIDEIENNFTELKEAIVKLNRSGKIVELYHIAVRIHF